MEREVAIGELDRVTGVVPALVADDDVEGGAEEIDDLPLALVPPLHADHDHIGHDALAFGAHSSKWPRVRQPARVG